MTRRRTIKGVLADVETYWDTEVSLTKMETQRYVRHPKFHVHGWAWQEAEFDVVDDGWGGVAPVSVKLVGDVRWAWGDGFLDWLAANDDVRVFVAHNAPFDATVLHEQLMASGMSWRPDLWVDTAGMARCIMGSAIGSAALGSLGELFGLGGKQDGGAALVNTRGMTRHDIEGSELECDFVAYATRDVGLMAALLERMIGDLPRSEWWVVDWSVRMMASPSLQIDMDTVDRLLEAAEARVDTAVSAAGVPATVLRSRTRFEAHLRGLGVELPVKMSPNTGELIPAASKSDMAFVGMIEELERRAAAGDEKAGMAAAACRARIVVGSSIVRTRAERFRGLAASWPVGPGSRRGWLRVPLAYAGAAQTKRFSGRDKLNLQNLPRDRIEVDGLGPVGLRDCIVAPRGHKLVVVDSSNIELRVLAALAGQLDVIERLSSGVDEYSVMAGRIFGRPIDKKRDPEERQIGKVAVLSLGYQSGWRTFQGMLFGFTGRVFDEGFCRRVVDAYRSSYTAVRDLWYQLDTFLRVLASGRPAAVPEPVAAAPLAFLHEPPLRIGFASRLGDVIGASVTWPRLTMRRDGDRDGPVYWDARKRSWAHIYGGKAVENLSQFLAREVVNWQTRDVHARTGRLPALQVHDELVYVVPDGEAEDQLRVCLECMSGRLDWWPELVTAAEGAVGDVYGDVK